MQQLINTLFELRFDPSRIAYNALIMWALLSVLYTFYDTVKQILTNPTIRTRFMCPKCFSFWLTLFFTMHVPTALAVSFIINLYSKYVKFSTL